jgi:hypothetical protein
MSLWAKVVTKAFYNNKQIRIGKPNVISDADLPNNTPEAPLGTLGWDLGAGDAYINTDGSTTWVKINA